jgi:hypothetical protein
MDLKDLMTMLNGNKSLPPLNPFAARSTYAMILTFAVTLANIYGIDLFEYTKMLGLGGTEAEVLQNKDTLVSGWQIIVNIALPIWYWFERRAPNYRLSFSST